MRVILASSSPRRKQLLEEAGLAFEVMASPAEEIYDLALGMAGLCEENGRLKATAVAKKFPEARVIGADTLVFFRDQVFKKPKDFAEATRTLRFLSGKVHQVCTGVCIAGPDRRIELFHEITDVQFRVLSDKEIADYIEREQPYDKAGSYGIQDSGGEIVERIAGAYDNVMGLPVAKVLEALGKQVRE